MLSEMFLFAINRSVFITRIRLRTVSMEWNGMGLNKAYELNGGEDTVAGVLNDLLGYASYEWVKTAEEYVQIWGC